MATNKSPSEYGEYRDQHIRGAPEELDEYGVWVKSPPQTLGKAQDNPIPAWAPAPNTPKLPPVAPAYTPMFTLDKILGTTDSDALADESGATAMTPPDLLKDFGKDILELEEEDPEMLEPDDEAGFDIPDVIALPPAAAPPETPAEAAALSEFAPEAPPAAAAPLELTPETPA
ncbi:MAG: hypothetical protein LBS86_06155, partial [Treponema sp.]|nr:hypothetical protein [Treponema sp.]